MKEELLRRYISGINWNGSKWSYNDILEDVRKLIGETPAIDIKYKKDMILNEVTGEASEVVEIDNITIVFTETDNKFKKIQFNPSA